MLTAAIAFITLRPDPNRVQLGDSGDTLVESSTGSAAGSQSGSVSSTGDAEQSAGTETTGATTDIGEGTQTASEDAAADSSSLPSVPRTSPGVPIDGLVNGRITHVDGAPASGVSIDLIASDPEGTLSEIVSTFVTGDDGQYGFDVADGCYVAIFTAPEGFSFPGVGEELKGPPVCVSADSPFTVGASIGPE